MESGKQKLAITAFIAAACGIGYCLREITHGPTSNEALLLSLFMTLLSILASWIVSRYYAKASYEDSLKVFALKAAEKVTNLSNELDRLSAFLQKALDEEEFASPNEELLAKTIRFEDAIHLITALKSVNDTSLSDWRGIIGNELSKQREEQIEEQEEREDRLIEIIERLEHVERESMQTSGIKELQERERLRAELGSLRSDMRALASQVGGVRMRPFKRKTIEGTCPHCSRSLEYTFNLKSRGTKKIDCTNCNARLYASSDGSEVMLRDRTPILESLLCPACMTAASRRIDPLQGTVDEFECVGCHAVLRAVRSKSGIKVRSLSSDSSGNVLVIEGAPHLDSTPPKTVLLTEELLNRIVELMGSQPWPKGRGLQVRSKLGLSSTTMTEAIRQLVSRGTFKTQIDGVLYEPTNGLPSIQRN